MAGNASVMVREINSKIGPSWRQERGKKHIKYFCPCGQHIVSVNSSNVSGKSRTLNNAMSEFRRCPEFQT